MLQLIAEVIAVSTSASTNQIQPQDTIRLIGDPNFQTDIAMVATLAKARAIGCGIRSP